MQPAGAHSHVVTSMPSRSMRSTTCSSVTSIPCVDAGRLPTSSQDGAAASVSGSRPPSTCGVERRHATGAKGFRTRKLRPIALSLGYCAIGTKRRSSAVPAESGVADRNSRSSARPRRTTSYCEVLKVHAQSSRRSLPGALDVPPAQLWTAGRGISRIALASPSGRRRINLGTSSPLARDWPAQPQGCVGFPFNP